MSEQPKFSEDQERRMAATLKRIRGGLNRENRSENPNGQFEEPAHIFEPEAYNAETK